MQKVTDKLSVITHPGMSCDLRHHYKYYLRLKSNWNKLISGYFARLSTGFHIITSCPPPRKTLVEIVDLVYGDYVENGSLR